MSETKEWLVRFAQEVTARADETRSQGVAAEFRCHDLVDAALASMPRVAADLPTGDDVAAAEAWLKERRSDKGQRTGKPPGLSELLAAYATDLRRSLT